jgi:alkyl sulfatase BDS1-like metallo-beta-lactamase superfamily hydrolase
VCTELGFGSENGPWRNIDLCGASELQNGGQKAFNARTLASLNFDQLFDTIAIQWTKGLAAPVIFEKEITIEFMVEDWGQIKKSGTGWHWKRRKLTYIFYIYPVHSPYFQHNTS